MVAWLSAMLARNDMESGSKVRSVSGLRESVDTAKVLLSSGDKAARVWAPFRYGFGWGSRRFYVGTNSFCPHMKCLSRSVQSVGLFRTAVVLVLGVVECDSSWLGTPCWRSQQHLGCYLSNCQVLGSNLSGFEQESDE